MLITSTSNGEIKRISSLKEKKYRKLYGEYLIEGVKMVKDAINFHEEIVNIVATETALKELYSSGIDEKSIENKIITVTENVIKYLSDVITPQGIVATVKIPTAEKEKPIGDCVLLDRVSDCGNLGTIIRTLSAVGIKDVYAINCADAYSPKTVRSSMSGIYHVKIHEIGYEDLGLFSDICVLTADMDGESVFIEKKPDKFCLVIGNEANGVSSEVLKITDKVIKIPMTNAIESLNAGVALSVIIYELKYGK